MVIEIKWHKKSDQPHTLSSEDRKEMKNIRKKSYGKYLAQIIYTVIYAPKIIISWFICSKKMIGPKKNINDFLGIALSLDSAPESFLIQNLRELRVKNILIRIGVWNLSETKKIISFIKKMPDCDFTISIMQDRASVINHKHWEESIFNICEEILPYCKNFIIGQATNRCKWGCFLMDEYLQLLNVSMKLKKLDEKIKIIGSSVIDFEPLATSGSLFHKYPLETNAISSGLYVDRRGSPKNRQYAFFNLKNKIKTIAAMITASHKTKNKLWITETNWPLKNKNGYAPASEEYCVSEKKYSQYMLEYIKIARKTNLVERVYWWQLVAEGYGLISNEENGFEKRKAFYDMKKMLSEEQVVK